MAKEPENFTLRHLREIRATLDERSSQLRALPRIEKQLGDLTKILTYALGRSTETQFRQSERQQKIDEPFEKLEELLTDEQPV